MNKIKEKIINLNKLLKYYSFKYYNEDFQCISDIEYDKLMLELKELEKIYPQFISKDSQTKFIGCNPIYDRKNIYHKIPMLSINNVYNKNDFFSFIKRIKNKINKKTIELCCELKFDGLAISLLYKNGILIQASTRGNGIYGENIFKNALKIKDIPKKLNGKDIPYILEVRGEVYMKKSILKEINENSILNKNKVFSNTRNAASGTIRNLDDSILLKRKLNFFCYGLGYFKNKLIKKHSYFLEKCKSFGLPINKYINIYNEEEKCINFYKKIEKIKKELDYDIDGIVIKVNDYKLQEYLGCSFKYPNWSIAFKFKSKEKSTIINDIKFKIGRTGLITPVALLKPIKIDGVIIKNATLHNENKIKELGGIKKGDKVIIKRAGGVIPEIIKVIKLENKNKKYINFPKKCPECNSYLKYTKKNVFCVNKFICKSQIKASIIHLSSKDAFNIKGFGKKIINNLVDKKIINSISDIFKINISDLIKNFNFSYKHSNNLINSLNKSKKITLQRFIYSLGIKGIGKSISYKLSKKFLTINKFLELNSKELSSIKDIGKTLRKNIIYFINDDYNKNSINEIILFIRIIK